MEKVARLTSLEARMMADYTAGLRGQGEKFVIGVKATPEMQFEIKQENEHSLCSNEAEVVMPVTTEPVWERPKVLEVEIRLEGGVSVKRSDLDAVFLSESAVEKFLFPYLASKYEWQAAAAAVKLAQEWYGRVPPLGSDPEEGRPVNEELVPFAVGHLPRSEYVILDEVAVLLKDGQGNVTVRRLSGRE